MPKDSASVLEPCLYLYKYRKMYFSKNPNSASHLHKHFQTLVYENTAPKSFISFLYFVTWLQQKVLQGGSGGKKKQPYQDINYQQVRLQDKQGRFSDCPWQITQTAEKQVSTNTGRQINPAQVSSLYRSEAPISALQCQQQLTSQVWVTLGISSVNIYSQCGITKGWKSDHTVATK